MAIDPNNIQGAKLTEKQSDPDLSVARLLMSVDAISGKMYKVLLSDFVSFLNINGNVEVDNATTGTINNLNVIASLLRFTGQGSVILTGINATDISGGQGIIIRNETSQPLMIKHNSVSSDAANRFYIAGEVDLPIVDKGSAIFYYSKTLENWLLIHTFGNSFSPQYIGDTGQVLITVGDGTTSKIDTIEIESLRPDITTAQTSANLNTLYPDAVLLQKIWCPNLSTGSGYYVLIDDVNLIWHFVNSTAV